MYGSDGELRRVERTKQEEERKVTMVLCKNRFLASHSFFRGKIERWYEKRGDRWRIVATRIGRPQLREKKRVVNNVTRLYVFFRWLL